MSKHVLSVLGAVMLTLAITSIALAQTTTTTVTKTVQNPDGTYTIIEYPAKKEITLNLTPVNITGAKGVATILRDDDGTRIKLNLANGTYVFNWIDAKTGALSGENEIKGGLQEIPPSQQSPTVLWVHTKLF